MADPEPHPRAGTTARLRAATVWLTGLPGAGKSTAAEGLHRRLVDAGHRAQVLDGDVLRGGLNADLAFAKEDRLESIRRAGEVALLLAASGTVAIAGLVSPYAAARDTVRARHGTQEVPFLEVWLSAPLPVCEARDPKQLYARARQGQITMMTGVDDPYEEPAAADLVLPTHVLDPEETASRLFDFVVQHLVS